MTDYMSDYMSDERRNSPNKAPVPAHSRRSFLAIAGAGTAAAAGAAVLGGAADADAASAPKVPDHVRTPLVAYVADAHSGEVTVLVDDREVVVHDKDLAARIARVASGGK